MSDNDKERKYGADDLYDDTDDLYDDTEEFYDEDYEDDRYSRLLDEIADLRRSVTASAAPYYPPAYSQAAHAPTPAPYPQPYAQPAGDVALYNELSRLREELNRAQNTQNMHVELSRLREEMAKRGGGTAAAGDDLKQTVRALQDAVEQLKAAGGGEATAKLAESLGKNDDLGDSLRFISEDISDIKETLGIDYEKLLTELAALKERAGGEGGEAVLDELKAIKEKLAAAEVYDVMAEILSLREEVKAARIVDQNDISGELEKMRDEIQAKLEAMLSEVKSMGDRPVIAGEAAVIAPTDGELNMLLSEVVSLRDELQAFKDERPAVVALPTDTAAAGSGTGVSEDNTGAILEELVALRAEFMGLREETEDADLKELKAELALLQETVDELKDAVSRRTTLDVDDTGVAPASSKELNVVIGEIIDIKDELKEHTGKVNARIDSLSEKADAVQATVPDLAYLKEDLEFLKTQLGDLQMAVALDAGDNAELDALRAENERLKAQLAEAESGQIAALKRELADVKALVSEPDMAVMSEILALRDEYQAMKERLEAVSARDDGDVMAEIGKLRDQLFAISMASVNDGRSDEAAYESYNNIILDEIAALRAEVEALKRSDKTAELAEDVAAVRDRLTADGESVAGQLSRIREELKALGKKDARSMTDLQSELDRVMRVVDGSAPKSDKTRATKAESADALLSRLAAEDPEIKD